MTFTLPFIGSLLALYGFGAKAHRPRARRALIEIGRASNSRLA
ncbi:hypothetical protein [Brevundimonas sp. LM2]|nr:hypothetical protein [Brevundimonas sp. LM2]